MHKSKVFVGLENTSGKRIHFAKTLWEAGIYAYSYSYSSQDFGCKADYDNLLFLKSDRVFEKLLLSTINWGC